MSILYLALYLIALGTGGLKSSVSGFGADQFDESDEKEKKQMNYFFNRFFFSISIGSLLAVTLLVYIQDNVGRRWGYGICASCMFLAIIVFLGGTKMYRFKKRSDSDSPLAQIVQVIVAALRNKNLKLPMDAKQLYEQERDVFSSKFGGPFWPVPTGRRDGSISNQIEALQNIPQPTFNFSQLNSSFTSKGLDIKDLVILSGGHTGEIGQNSHLCQFTM